MLSVSATQPVVWLAPLTPASALPDIGFHTTPSLSPYRRDLLAAAINHLNELKNKNPARMYLFNLFMQNNAMNEFAVEFMSFIAEYAQYLYARYPAKVLYEIIQESVGDACSFSSSILIVRIPELAQLLSGQTYTDATRNVNAYWEVVRDMSNYFPGYSPRFKAYLGDPTMFQQTNPAAGYATIQQPMPGQHAQTQIYTYEGRNYARMPDGSLVPAVLGQNGVFYAAPPGTQMPMQNAGWPGQSTPPMGMPYGYPQQPAASGVFTGGPQNFGQSNAYIPPAPGAQDDTFMPSSVRVQSQKSMEQSNYGTPANSMQPGKSPWENPAKETMQSVELPKACRENWKPNKEQPYLVTFDPDLYREEFVKGPEGQTYQQLVLVKAQAETENEEMDRDQHLLPIVRVERARRKKFMRHIQIVNDIPVKTIIEQIDKGEVTTATKMIQDSWFSCVSVTEAISAAQIRHLEKLKDGHLDIYHTFANIMHILPGMTEDHDLIDRLGRANKENTTVLKLLKDYGTGTHNLLNMQNLPDEKVPELQARLVLYQKVNTFLTQIVNETLRYSLSTEVKIDSYADDFQELEGYMRNHYSDIHVAALRGLDTQINEELFSFSKAVDVSPIVGDYTLGEDSGTLDFSSFSELVTVTSVALTSQNLFGENLEKTSHPNGIYVDPEYHKLLGLTVDYVLRNQQLLGFSTYRHYIVTSDAEIFRVHKAALANTGGIVCRASLS